MNNIINIDIACDNESCTERKTCIRWINKENKIYKKCASIFLPDKGSCIYKIEINTQNLNK